MEILLKRAASVFAICAFALFPLFADAVTCGTGSNITFTVITGGGCRGYITTTGSGTFTVPTNWNSTHNTIEAVGYGGSGATAVTTIGGSGGGGGAYAAIYNLTLTQGGSVSYAINTSDTYFNGAASTSASVSASAGTSASGATPGVGGTTANSTGTVEFRGGNGGTRGLADGAGGGGAAGPSGAGGDGSNGVGSSNGGDGGQGDVTAGGAAGFGGITGCDSASSGSDGGPGSAGAEWDATHGTGGGGGGGGSGNGLGNFGGAGGNGGLYGGGGGGGGGRCTSGATASGGGAGRQGIIVVTYYPRLSLAKPPNNLGLVGYWPFNEATSTSAGDFSGNGNNGTLAGGTLPSWTSGKFGGALTFGAANNQVTISGPALTTTHSISMWVYPTAGPSGCASSICALFALAGSQGLVYTTGNVAQYLGGGAGPDVSSSALPLNTWSNIVVSVSAGGSTMYINGVSAGTGSNVTAYTPNRIGGDTTFSQTFPGKVDEVRVYSRALSAAEALALYKQGTAGAARGNASSQTLQNGTTLGNSLKGLWTFDGGALNWLTSKAYDLSGNAVNGTLTSMSQASVAIGKLGQALTFNGTSSYVDLGNPSALKSNSCTFAAWVKTTSDTDLGFFAATQGAVSNHEWDIELGPSTINLTNELITIFYANGGITNVMGYTTATRTELFDGAWHHIAITEDGSSTKIYLDGNSKTVTTGNGSDTGSCTGQDATLDTFEIGAGKFGGTQQIFFNGSIDDARFYNRALSATEITQLYKLGKVLVKP